MFKAIGQLFRALFVSFEALEKVADTVNNLADIGKQESAGLGEQLAVEREARLTAFRESISPKSKATK